MIIYNATKEKFINDVKDGHIADNVDEAFLEHLGRHTSSSEYTSWNNSMLYMRMAIEGDKIPDNAHVAIEYQVPLTSKRVDFIISGKNSNNEPSMVIVELKQWSHAEATDQDGVVLVKWGKEVEEKAHPSYQAWSYQYMLETYNEEVRDKIKVSSCAFLHNYDESNKGVTDSRYDEYLKKAPVFLKDGSQKLYEYISQRIVYANKTDLVFSVENGKLKPSKQLADSLASVLNGNPEFLLLDDQKVLYEKALKLARKAQLPGSKKQVLIVEGGPGTGKSVLAIQLLSQLISEGNSAFYVTKTSEPRKVYKAKVRGKCSQDPSGLFVSSGQFVKATKDKYDALIVDEAHRLNRYSGYYSNSCYGENQIKEIINASRFSLFLIDDRQIVDLKDIGRKSYIEEIARAVGAEPHFGKLQSQFRCNGSDGYLSWLEHALQINSTANIKLSSDDFDFKIFDDPDQLFKAIEERNGQNQCSRVVAGYCWPWVSDLDPTKDDIIFDKFGFHHKWNKKSSKAWSIDSNSIDRIGCIHTCQGMEFDYVGVIVGNDIRYENNRVITDVKERAYDDFTVKKKNKLLSGPEADKIYDEIIKNTYRVLMTRGMKGCYVYFCDENLKKHFIRLMEHSENVLEDDVRIEPAVNQDVKYIDYLPCYSMEAAARKFALGKDSNESGWVNVEESLNTNMFVIKAHGNALSPTINDGDLCLCKRNPMLDQGKIVVVAHPGIFDPDYDGEYSFKRVNLCMSSDIDGQNNFTIDLTDNDNRSSVKINGQDNYSTIFAEFIRVL